MGLQAASVTGLQAEYRQKLTTVEKATSLIKSNDRIYLTGGSPCLPYGFVDELTKRAKGLENVYFNSFGLHKPLDLLKSEYIGHVRGGTYFMGPAERKLYPQGNLDVYLLHYSQLKWFIENRMKPDVAVVVATPPDENGNMSFGARAFATKAAVKYADRVIVEVNEKQPFLYGGETAFVNIREATCIYEDTRDVPTWAEAPVTEVEEKIAAFVVSHIPNGATIQIGFGGIANAVGYFLKDHKDIGVYSELIPESMMSLVETGVINGSKKTFHPGKITASLTGGSTKFYEWLHTNKMIDMHAVYEVNDLSNIAKNKDLISINSCLMSDLTGQVGSESMGLTQYGGSGGQLDFVRGASLAEGGKSFLCMKSTFKAKDGTLRSTITTTLPAGTCVTVPRNDTQFIVTEYGVADLRNRSIKERVIAMVNIAYPDFREQLLKEATDAKMFYKVRSI